MKVVSVTPASPASRAGVRAGHELVAVDGGPVRDSLELRFRGSGEDITLTLLDENGRRRSLRIHKEYDQDLGIELAPWKTRRCRNRCIF